MTADASSVYPSLIGAELGGFQIVQELANGGMGTVYLGHRVGLGGFGQPAAIKVIHPHMAQQRSFVEMFVDEARIASCIHHPNVCRVLDFGKARGTFYLAMEYLLGETWAQTLRFLSRQVVSERIASQLLAHVIAQACEGLHAAHEAVDQRGMPLQIVHRDVSPQNLFVGYDGSVRVLDFGIACAADRLHSTRYGTVKGRYSYMAPEQMVSDPVDRRADIWSLGVVLREGLTRKTVFRRSTDAETVYAVTRRILPEWDTPVHPELRRIAEKAMQWEPELRYATAREMGQDLARFVSTQENSLGMAEISLCMHQWFAPQLEEKRALLQRAASEQAAPPTLTLPPAPEPLLPEEPATVDYRTPRLVEKIEYEPELTPTLVRELSNASDLEPPTTRWEPRKRASRNPRRNGMLSACAALLACGLIGASMARQASSPVLEGVRRSAVLKPAVIHVPAPRAEERSVPPRPSSLPLVQQMVESAPELTPVVIALPEELAPDAAEPTKRSAARERRHARRAHRDVHEAVSAPGTLSISTVNGWADVYLGTRKLGTTPGQFELPSGTHTLTLLAHGTGAGQRELVQIHAGQVQRARVVLEAR